MHSTINTQIYFQVLTIKSYYSNTIIYITYYKISTYYTYVIWSTPILPPFHFSEFFFEQLNITFKFPIAYLLINYIYVLCVYIKLHQ